MKRKLARTSLAAFAVAALCGAAAWGAHADEAQRRLAVTGSGTAAGAPDIARVGFGVTVRNASAADAFAEAGRVMAAILAAVAEAGVAAEDVRTTDLSLTPVYAGGGDEPLRIDAHSASHQVQATVRDLGALGALLDAAARAGATDFAGVTFDVADRAALLDAARAAAVADAMRAAAVLSEGARVTLGAPVDIAMGHSGGPERAFRSVAMSDAATPIAPGTITVTASVSITYALE